MEKRETIFISHATPEDNDFTIWLASRLQLLGYDVWIDKNALIGGEKFWEDIDQTIRYKTIKFLLVYSNNICQQPGKLKDGIYKEFSLAESISKQENISDFIILLNSDNAPYNLFIGADRLNQISFYDNWANGLKSLLRKMEKDNIPKSSQIQENGFSDWYENEYTTNNGVESKNELYYSNYWSIPELPKFFYMYQFENEKQAKAIHEVNDSFPIIKIANVVTTFDEQIDLTVSREGKEFEIKPKETHKIKVSDLLVGFEKELFPTQRDAENHFRRLLQRTFHLLMKSKGLFWYEMANKKQAYFYPLWKLKKNKVSFEYQYRTGRRKKKTKSVVGKYLTLGNWHFALSSKPILFPTVGYSLKSHITFTKNGFELWDSKDAIHSHRRKKGKRFFNEEWRDMLYAFLNGLKDERGKIQLQLNQKFTVELTPETEVLWADFGYYEPKDKNRQEILNQSEKAVEDREMEDFEKNG